MQQERDRLFFEQRWVGCAVVSVILHAAVLAAPVYMKSADKIDTVEIALADVAGSPVPAPSNSERITKLEHPSSPLKTRPRNRPVEPAKTAILCPKKETGLRSDSINDLAKDTVSQTTDNDTPASGGQETKPASGGSGGPHASGQSGDGGIGEGRFGSPDGPRFLHRAIPEYPFIARKRNMEGKVVLAAIIDEHGRLSKVEVIEASHQLFVEPSIDALKKSTFLPARRNGVVIPMRALIPIRFSLKE